jgi:hypothetical protein
MAEFNPEMRLGNIPDWTNAPGRLIDMSDLFQGLTKGAGAAVEILATDQQNKVDNKVRDAAEAAAEQGRLESLGVTDIPAAMKQEFDRATVYRQALDAGAYDPTKFNTRMIAWSKQMRAQYPGYTNLIDAHIARVTGSTPANEILSSIVKEREELVKAAASSEGQTFTRAKELAEVLPPETMTLYMTTGDATVRRSIELQAFRLKSVEAERKRFEDELKTSNDANATQAATLLAKEVDKTTVQFFQGVLGKSGMSLNNLRQTITKMSEGGFSEEETAQIISMGEAAKAWLDQEAARITTSARTQDGRSIAELLANDFTKMDNQLKRINELKGMVDGLIKGDKTGVLELRTTLEAARNDAAMDKIMAGSQGEILRGWKALSTVLPPDVMSALYTETLQKDPSDPIKAAFKSAVFFEAVGTDKNLGTLTEDYIQKLEEDPELKAKFNEGYREGVEAIVTTAKDEKLPLEVRGKSFMAIVGDTEGKMLQLLSDKPDKTGWSSRDKAFRVFTTPEMAATAEKLGMGQKYRDWIFTNGQKMYGDSIGDVNSLNTNSSWFTYRWNPERLGFDLTFADGAKIPDKVALAAYIRGTRNDIGQKNLNAGAEEVFAAQSARQSAGMIQKINMINEAMVAALKAENPKITTEELNAKILAYMGDLNTDPQKNGLMKQIIEFVQRDIDLFATKAQAKWEKDQKGENFGVDPGGDLSFTAIPGSSTTSTVGTTPDTGDETANSVLAFIHGAEGADYNTVFGGGKVDAAGMTVADVLARTENAGSSAFGAVQVMKKTLQGLVKNGVVTPDQKMDQATQDQIGMALLKEAGYDRWKAGEMSSKRFADRLADIWASIPNAEGKSKYEGVGPNKATVGYKQIMELLHSLEG